MEAAHLQTALAKLETIAHGDAVSPIASALGTDAQLAIVGGAVRDTLLLKDAGDVDLASVLTPEEVTSRLEKNHIRVIPTGLQHQTVTAFLETIHRNIEITTFRKAGISPTERALGTSLEEDLTLRDFTINAIAYDVAGRKLIDPNEGKKDLFEKVIRTPGSATERFNEDPLRILRMVRFAVQLGFEIDPDTWNAAHALREKLRAVSVERIRDEFTKVLLSPDPKRGFILFEKLDVLKLFLPELQEAVGFEQNVFHHEDVFIHTLSVVERTEPELIVRLGALFHDIAKPRTLSVGDDGMRHFYLHEVEGAEVTRDALTRLRFSNAVIEGAVTLVRTHMRPLSAGAGGMRRILRDTGEHYDAWRELKEADAGACLMEESELQAQLTQFDSAMAEVKKGPAVSPLSSLAVNGTDLLKLGLPASPRVGEILRALHERVLDDPALNTRDSLLELARQMMKEN